MSGNDTVVAVGFQRSSDIGPAKRETHDIDDGTSFDKSKSLKKRVIAYYDRGDAEAILSLFSTFHGKNSGVDMSTNHSWDPLLLWVRPNPCCLHFLAECVRVAGLSSLASVGCGTGLLEWLLQATTGVSVTGYEVNGDWWSSKYAPPIFIPLTYVDPEVDPPEIPYTHALMCCYFNNSQVFRQYVEVYEGPILIIIGSQHKGRYSEPKPLDYVDVHPWTLTQTHNINETDLIACYIRDQRKLDAVNTLRCPRILYK